MERRRNDIKDAWENGRIADFELFANALANATAVGECRAYKYLQELSYDQFLGELDNGEFKRPETAGSGGADSGV